MNLLNSTFNSNLRLLSRNEGKIKSYESCSDVRAWSHDQRARDHYLKEWIKRDMPICVFPGCTLARFLRTMTCRSRAKTTPRCHPDCKSKVLLESICTSCHVIKECLKNNPSFDTYFAEEEFETSHWPCDKCLDVLKSIKMFWKIIVEKVFGINFSKSEEFESVQDSRTDNVKSVAKLWEKEIVQQAFLVKNITPLLNQNSNQSKTESPSKTKFSTRKETATKIPRPYNRMDNKEPTISSKVNKMKSSTSSLLSQKTRTDPGRSSGTMRRNTDKSIRKLHACTSVRVRMVDAACETSNFENEELKTYKNNIEFLQQRCNCQEIELDKLNRENNSLKIELQNYYKTCSWKSRMQPSTPQFHDFDSAALVPKPFECCIDEIKRENSVKSMESEMIITMKNCKNDNFKHVSLLQVLHKTNEPVTSSDEHVDAPGIVKENPIHLLTKVQNTFGEIVRREILIANNRMYRSRESDIDANFFRPHNSRSAPSCSTICSNSASSESNLVEG